MPGNNHKPWCACPWCTRGLGSHVHSFIPSYGWDYYHIPFISNYKSFINPNATCPVCGEQVYFYQSPYGGKVYFDELGPPWQKHPCITRSHSPEWECIQ